MFIVGLDSCEYEIVEKFIQLRPDSYFAKLSRSAVHGHVQNEEGFTGSVWPSFYTGKAVSEHQFYFFEQLQSGTYKQQLKQYGDFNETPCFWEILAEEGFKTIIIDPPKYIAKDQPNSIQVTNWGNHDPDAFNSLTVFPSELRKEIINKYPKDPLGKNDWGGTGPMDYETFILAILKNIERKLQLALDYLSRHEWHLFFIGFDELHQAGHILFDLHLQSNELELSWEVQVKNDPFLRIIDRISVVCENLSNKLPKETDFLVYSSNGMGVNHFSKEAIQTCVNLIQGKSNNKSDLHGFLRRIWLKIPLRFHKHLWKAKNRLRNIVSTGKMKNELFFILSSTEGESYFRLNVSNREPNGKIKSQTEYNQLLKSIEESFRSILNADTGQQVVNNVLFPNSTIAFDQHSNLPDIIIVWEKDQEANKLIYKDEVVHLKKHKVRKGSHRINGFYYFIPTKFKYDSISTDLASTKFFDLILQSVKYNYT